MYRGCHITASDGQAWFLTGLDEALKLDTSDDGRNATNIALLIDAWTCLVADSPLNSSTASEKPLRTFRIFRRWLLAGPLLEKVKLLSSYADRIVSTMTLTGADTYTGEFVTEMRDTPIFREYHTWFRTGDPRLLAYILSFLWFGKKLDYEDPAMDATAFRGWLEVEQKLSGLTLSPVLLHDLRRIMEGLIGSFRLNKPLSPKFGPGIVSEPGIRGDILKSNAIRFDAKIDRLFFRSPQLVMRGPDEYGYHPEKILPDPSRWHKATPISATYSTYQPVPKDVTKSRSICREPNTYMFAQQAVLDVLLSYFRAGPMNRFVRLEDQSRNREMARFGSYTTEIDTIDLSSASDSVHVDLVRAIMPRRLWHALLATRTKKVLVPSGEVIEVKKFAPMGSALCFPTQCLVFTSVSILAALQESEHMAIGEDRHVSDRWFSNFGRTLSQLFAKEPGYHHQAHQFQPLAVYGDDIAIDTRLTARTVHLLNVLGFTVNRQKSFEGGAGFRESCGGYYHDGEDVTPLRFTAKRARGDNFASVVASVISLANRAGDRGYRNVRRLLIHYGLSIEPYIGFTRSKEQAMKFYSLNPRNRHLKSRYNKDLQRDEYRCVTLLPERVDHPRESEKAPFDKYRLMKWWIGRTGNSITSEFSFGVPRYDARGAKLRRRWTPVEY